MTTFFTRESLNLQLWAFTLQLEDVQGRNNFTRGHCE